MNCPLAQTGTVALLEELSPFVPDEFINQVLGPQRGPGRRRRYSAAQLYRLLLLALLSPAHSFNLLVELLAEHRAWRQFARLGNRHEVPDATLLHDARAAFGVSGLRRINVYLLRTLLHGSALGSKTLAIIDATDLPAATSAYKKSSPVTIRRNVQPWVHARSRPVKAAGLSVTRSTACGCGLMVTAAVCNWYHWSVG